MSVEPPEIAKPFGYETVDVLLPSCAIPLPPVRALPHCGATEIGKSIDVEVVCQLLVALKRWVASKPKDALSVHLDDWTRVWAVCVSRLVSVESPYATEKSTPRSFLRLEAYIPNRSQRVSVQMSEQSWSFEYFVSAR